MRAVTPGQGETARFFRIAQAYPLDCLSARFLTHAYALHTHDTFVVGAVIAGCEAFRLGRETRFATPGKLCLINPGEVHDGRPADGGFAYRMTYPTAAFLADVAADAGESHAETPLFPQAVVSDPDLAARFAALHRAAEDGAADLALDESLLAAFALALARHAEAPAVRAGLARGAARESGPVARALAYLDAHYADTVRLDALAEAAGIPRTRLIRAMRRETGLTPHAWLADRRVRAAQAMLRAGAAPAQAAAACGFCDQSHLNRAFKARIGVTPGAFRDIARPRVTFIQDRPARCD